MGTGIYCARITDVLVEGNVKLIGDEINDGGFTLRSQESLNPSLQSAQREPMPFTIWITLFCIIVVTLYLTIFYDKRARNKD